MSYLVVALGIVLGMIAAFISGDRYRKNKKEKEKAIEKAFSNEEIKNAEKNSNDIGDMPIDDKRIRATIRLAKKANND